MDESQLASLISGLVTAGTGISQLSSNTTANAASLASPFASQYAGYQSYVPGQLTEEQNTIGNSTNSLAGITGALTNVNANVTGNPQLMQLMTQLAGSSSSVPSSVSGSASNLQSQLSALSGNFMSNPAIQAELQTGLGAVNAGAAASGTVGSGSQLLALQNYGQNFAASQYATQYNDILNANQQEYAQNTGATTLGAGLEAQQFSQASTTNNAAVNEQQSSIADIIQQLTSAGGIQENSGSLQLNSEQGLLNTLSQLSGATTGSPATAGTIASQQFGNSQQAAANVGSGLTGILSGLSGTSSVSSLLGSLLSSSGSGSLSTLLGSGASSLLGQSGAGTSLGNSLETFTSGSDGSTAFGNVFGGTDNSTNDLINNVENGDGVASAVGGLDAGTGLGDGVSSLGDALSSFF